MKIKKIIIIASFFSLSCYAQFSSGLKAGGVLSTLKFEKSEFEKGGLKPSFFIGSFVEYKFNKLTPEIDLNYIQAGSNGKVNIRPSFDEQDIEIDSKYQLNLLSLGLSIKYMFIENFYVKFGGYYGQILTIKNKVSESPNQQTNLETNLKDDWNNNDYGLVFGLNYDISNYLFLESNYSLGLSNMRGVENYQVNNRIIKIGLGYKF